MIDQGIIEINGTRIDQRTVEHYKWNKGKSGNYRGIIMEHE